jgi:hypothetical protein
MKATKRIASRRGKKRALTPEELEVVVSFLA